MANTSWKWTGRSVTRPQLSHEQVLENARSYQDQAFKILRRERSRIVFNGEWFGSMSFQEVIRLNSRVTLQQMLVREDFRERLDRGQAIRAHEIQYPIMQGWDSVKIKADVELGGTDQLFNIMVGRDLQREGHLAAAIRDLADHARQQLTALRRLRPARHAVPGLLPAKLAALQLDRLRHRDYDLFDYRSIDGQPIDIWRLLIARYLGRL